MPVHFDSWASQLHICSVRSKASYRQFKSWSVRNHVWTGWFNPSWSIIHLGYNQPDGFFMRLLAAAKAASNNHCVLSAGTAHWENTIALWEGTQSVLIEESNNFLTRKENRSIYDRLKAWLPLTASLLRFGVRFCDVTICAAQCSPCWRGSSTWGPTGHWPPYFCYIHSADLCFLNLSCCFLNNSLSVIRGQLWHKYIKPCL